MAIIIPANTLSAGGYDVANSCRFESGDTAYLTRTCGSTASSYTVSMWVKTANSSGTTTSALWWNAANSKLNWELNDNGQFYYYDSGTPRTTGYYRDTSSWYHVVFKVSSNTGTLYINGAAAAGITGIGSILSLQTGNALQIGADNGGSTFDGYIAEVCFIDGSALNADQFGEFDEDSPTIWKPKDVSGLTFGTKGFWLDFEDSSDLGKDVSGNGNDLTATNLAATDQTTDTPTNNFATLNPLEPSPNAIAYTEGNTVAQGTGGNGGRFAGGTIALSSGKWWCEVKVTVSGSYPIIGIIDSRSSFKMNSAYFVDGSQTTQNRSGYALFSNSDVYNNGDDNFGDFGVTYATNDIISVGLDLDSSPPTILFQKNGGDEETFDVEVPPSGFYNFPAIGAYFTAAIAKVNFGNPPFSISSAVADENEYGSFEHAPKSGYYALCTKNLAEFG